MSLSMFREAVAAASDRLKTGEKPDDVPCPKCGNERGVKLEPVGASKTAVCGICAFHWIIV